MLLFVIRDHIGTTPLKNLAATLETDLVKIWDGLSKPPGLENCKLSDFFDLSFTGLPHKILAADAFERGVADLRQRFVDKANPGFVFKPAYHKRIPADGVAFYMEGIWEQVQSNKDLDLPTQQELLAQFRCDEIAGAALAEFNEQAKSQRKPVEAGRVIDGLGAMMRSWRAHAIGLSPRVPFASRPLTLLVRRALRPRRVAVPPGRVQAQARGPARERGRGTLAALPRPAQEPAQGEPRTVQDRRARRARGRVQLRGRRRPRARGRRGRV
jgi:hypothetical protein